MKRLLLFVLLIAAAESWAQNWNPLPPVGVKRYFVNETGYLRGIRVDSIRVSGSDSVFYPFRSVRGLVPSTSLDSNGSSWLGKAVRKRADGTWLFNTWRNDTVIIKSFAAVGDTWRFFDDTAALWYRATVTSVNTQMVLGMLDSIKTITLTAMSGTGPLPSDSLNGWTVVLSKNHGFAHVPDLYMLPYPKDGNLNVQKDLFFALVTGYGQAAWGAYTNVRKARFSLIDYRAPTTAVLYSPWHPGDVAYYSFAQTVGIGWWSGYFIDTVEFRIPFPTSDVLSMKRWRWNTTSASNLTQSIYAIYLDSTTATDTSRMPEEYPNTTLTYFAPANNSYGLSSPVWTVWSNVFSGTTAYPYQYPREDIYKAGLGHVYFRQPHGSAPATEHQLLAYRIRGVIYGTPFGVPNSVRDISGNASTVFASPIPTSSGLRIHHPAAQLTFSFADVTGRTVHTAQSNSSTTTTDIDVSTWPAGLYTMTATADGSRHTQKIIIAR